MISTVLNVLKPGIGKTLKTDNSSYKPYYCLERKDRGMGHDFYKGILV